MQQHFADDEPFISALNTPAAPQPVFVARQRILMRSVWTRSASYGGRAGISTANHFGIRTRKKE
jgi:hypothetical protein